MRLVLASQSPRRREMLAALGFALEVRPAHVDESVVAGEAPRDYVLRLAREKARAVADGAAPVVAADTTVVLAGEILGKPTDDEDARRMLRALSDRAHEVVTAVCVRNGDVELAEAVASAVVLGPLSDAFIDWYVATGEPHDKAGAYAVQGLAGAVVRRVEGSVTNVVGLPLAETLSLLSRSGVPLPWEATR
jgi:septum formation protein